MEKNKILGILNLSQDKKEKRKKEKKEGNVY
jgi:hypothetical protein